VTHRCLHTAFAQSTCLMNALFSVEMEFALRKPEPADIVLVNPSTGRPMTRPRLYERIQALGRRVGLSDIHPQIFRDMIAVEMRARGLAPTAWQSF
jgi:hypothetical protein